MMSKRLVFFSAGSFFFLLFVSFSYLVHKDLFTQLDFNTTVKLQDHISRRFDLFFSYFSVIGSFDISVILLFLLIFWRRKLSSLLLLVPFGGILLFELFGKIFIDHSGPPFRFARYKSLIQFPTEYIPHPASSYPSGHSARTLFFSVLIGIMVWKSSKLSLPVKILIVSLLVIYDSIMLMSRVYLGEHWTTDVIGGTLLGLALGLLTAGVLKL